MSRCGTMPGLRRCSSLFTSNSSLACCKQRFRFLDLGVRLDDVGSRRDQRRIDLGDLALGRLQRGLLLRAVQP